MNTCQGGMQGDFDNTGIVTFDYTLWTMRYPEFSEVNEALAGAYWTEAGLYLANNPGSIVADCATRQLLLGMLTAHLASLNATVGGQSPSGLVGRISSATQGSVSVSVDTGGTSANAEWFLQTRYGAAFWQATAQYRTMRYYPSPTYVDSLRRFGGYPYGPGGRYGGYNGYRGF